MGSLRAHIITRALLTIPMIFILVTLVFVILRIMPGDPVRAMIRPGAPPEYIASIKHELGLDRPLFLNFRGSSAIVAGESVLLRSGPSTDEKVVMLLEEGNELVIGDRTTTSEGEWLRLSTGGDFEVWVTPERVSWLRRVDFRFSPVESAESPGGEWVRVHIHEGSLEGWAPVEHFKVRANIFDSQYFNYLFNLLRLDLGTSLAPVRGRPIVTDLKEKFPATVELSVFSMIVTVAIGIFTGAYAAHKRRSVADYSFRLYSIVIYAVPVFWLGLMLQLVFSVYLGWLPVYGRIGTGMRPKTIAEVYNLSKTFSGPFGEKVLAFVDFLSNFYVLDSILTRNWPSLLSSLKHLTLPSLTLGLYLSGVFTRLTRANMLDVLRQDYITAARARGIRERVVVYKHALKNAFIPILTMLGLQFALLMAGAVLTESTFSWPGMGRFLVERIWSRDFPSIQGGVVFFALLVATVSLVVDVIYAYLDPRIRY